VKLLKCLLIAGTLGFSLAYFPLASIGATEKATAKEKIDEEKLHAIKQLMTVTGAGVNNQQFASAFAQQLISALKVGNPDISEQAVQIVKDEVKRMIDQEFTSEKLQKEIYPIYARYFTLEELQGLIAFNQSPIGQKANRVMPQLMQDSLSAVQQWTQIVGPKISASVLQRFEAEGIEVRVRDEN